MYANIALVPNKIGSISDARVWYMLLVRFVVGIGTGKFLFAVKDDLDELRLAHAALVSCHPIEVLFCQNAAVSLRCNRQTQLA